MNKKELDFLITKYNLTPNKLRGQNFLISDDILDNIVKASEVDKNDLVLEVGPGLASLTQKLINNVGKVIAFEIEENFKPLLNKLEKTNSNLEIIWQNILSLTEEQWSIKLKENNKEEYRIVANIPYYLTAKFIQKFLLASKQPKSMTLMIQKEVAERITKIGDKHTLLSLSVLLYAKAKIIQEVKKDNFYPIPKVDSAIIHIYNIHSWDYSVNEKETWQLIHRGFAHKRKKLINNLLSDSSLNKEKLVKIFNNLELDLNIRAEKLSIDNWISLAKQLNF